jgi:hypothetical protein
MKSPAAILTGPRSVKGGSCSSSSLPIATGSPVEGLNQS